MTKREINTMGKGFFVVKLYSELIDNNKDWEDDKNLKERLTKYKRIRGNAKEMIDLLNEILKSNCSVRYEGNSNYDNNKIMKMANELLEKIKF